MPQKLLTEFYELCKDGICQDLLTEREKRESSNGVLYLSGRIQAADTPNGNGRIYPKKVLQKEINNYMKIVKDNRATGELDHPEDAVVNLKNQNVKNLKTKIFNKKISQSTNGNTNTVYINPMNSLLFVLKKLQKDKIKNKSNFYVFTGSSVGVVPILGKGIYKGIIDKLGSVSTKIS